MKEKTKTNQSNILHDITTAFLCVAAATGLSLLFRSLRFPETNVVVIYILSVVLTARLTKGYVYGITSTVISIGAFNYFFTAPYFTLSVSDPTYFITFAVMTITAVITSALTSKVKKNALQAQEKEAAASALYKLTNHLTDANGIADIAGISVSTISDVMDCRAACLCFDESGQPEKAFVQQKNAREQIHRSVSDPDALKLRIENLTTPYDAGDEFFDWPIYGNASVLGVMRIPKEAAEDMTEAQTRLLRSMIESSALAMDRFRSMQEGIRSREEIERERYRSNLLRAISHDLRTPLSSIMGTGEMLMDMTEKDDVRYPLAESVYRDADWLYALVENILNLTRLQDGVSVNKEYEAVEEIIEVALTAIGKRASDREITVNIPGELLLVPMDARLIEQVLMNLLNNAVKHTAPEDEISITVAEDSENHNAVFSVADRGGGISPNDLPHIFQMFYTTQTKTSDAQRGVGLGLAICQSIIAAHGGTITGKNRTDGPGAEFLFTLPMEDETND